MNANMNTFATVSYVQFLQWTKTFSVQSLSELVFPVLSFQSVYWNLSLLLIAPISLT